VRQAVGVATAARPIHPFYHVRVKAWFNPRSLLILQADLGPCASADPPSGDPVSGHCRPWWDLRRFEH